MSGTDVFTVFGSEFDELEDESKDSVSKRPLRVQDEVVTDEKGRRRFHGAFTGGFSAGYFNTVGTKEGWTPSTFKSSRSERPDVESTERRPEDFMDQEDLGEYGIAPRHISTAARFRDEQPRDDATSLSAAGGELKRQLAWERPAPATATTAAKTAAEDNRLAQLIQPVSDSLGTQLLKQMGWRPGQGIGAKHSKRMLERLKKTEKVYGVQLPPESSQSGNDTTTIEEAEEMAPGFQFAPDDIVQTGFELMQPKTDLHGLGYHGLQSDTGLLRVKEVSTAFRKTAKANKGISGQAFGVGAFEEDDDDIYASEDLSNYDYTLGGANRAPSTSTAAGGLSEDFVPPSSETKGRQSARQFYAAPRLPRDHRVGHRPIPFTSDVPTELLSFLSLPGQRPDAAQRAQVWSDEGSSSSVVMTMLKTEDRERIEAAARVKTERERQQQRRTLTPAPDADPFAAEPDKRRRYRQYVDYLRRGLNLPQPVELTEWQWEKQLAEFQDVLPDELRLLLPEMRQRALPLARADIALPFAQVLQAKFTKSDLSSEQNVAKGGCADEEKREAVKMKLFGQMTREKFPWYPDGVLSKRFNVAPPYPGSTLVGCPYFAKEARRGPEIFDFGLHSSSGAALPSTSAEIAARRGTSAKNQTAGATSGDADSSSADQSKTSDDSAPPVGEVEIEKPPIDLFKMIFTQSDEEPEEASESDDDEDAAKKQTSASDVAQGRLPAVKHEPTPTLTWQRGVGISASTDKRAPHAPNMPTPPATNPTTSTSDDTKERGTGPLPPDDAVPTTRITFNPAAAGRRGRTSRVMLLEDRLSRLRRTDVKEEEGQSDEEVQVIKTEGDESEEEVYGPALPPPTTLLELPPVSVVREKRSKSIKEKKHKRHKKHHKHEKKKSKKIKKEKRSLDQSSSTEEISSDD